MIEFLITAGAAAFIVLNALRRRRGPTVAAPSVSSGKPWYQKMPWLTLALWLIGFALLYLVAARFWPAEKEEDVGLLLSRENRWITGLSFALLAGVVAKDLLAQKAQTDASHTYERGGKRSGTGKGILWAAVVSFVLLLSALTVIKILQNLEYGLSNAPERMALHGYVPRESVAAAAPALPEVHTVTAPPLGADGTTNWSEAVVCDRRFWTYFGVADALRDYIALRADGVVTNFVGGAGAVTNAFYSTTELAIPVKWLQSRREMTPQEVKELLD